MYNILCGLTPFKEYKEVISDFLSCKVKSWQELTNIYNEKSKNAEMIIFVKCMVSYRRVCRILSSIN